MMQRLFARRGKILAVKLGYNPNSSSLGVDVTFLLLGMAAIALITPLIGLFLRARRPQNLLHATSNDAARANNDATASKN